MIRSRRTVIPEDDCKCCGRCEFLQFNGYYFFCRIDELIAPDKDIITICICDKFKEVKKTDGKL